MIDKRTNSALLLWPVHGWAYDVLIGGLYPDQKPQWDFESVHKALPSHESLFSPLLRSLRAYTFEIAVPVTMGTQVLRRVRQLFNEAALSFKPVTSTYRSGINIKFGKPFDSLLGQTTERTGIVKGDWSKVCSQHSSSPTAD